MTLPATLAVPTLPSGHASFAQALPAAIRRLSWRVVGSTLAIAVALDVWWLVELSGEQGLKLPRWEGYLSGTIINVLMAFCIMFTTLVADERVARGAKRIPAYAWAVVIGSAVASLAQWEVHGWLRLRTRDDVAGIPYDVTIMQPAVMFFEYLIWGSIMVFIYVHRRSALLATARMNAAGVRRADAQRRTLESRLQALQARVEPQFLFNTLAQVRDLYDRDGAGGTRMLDHLIVYLRAALPHLRESTSTLENELKLTRAYFGIMQPSRSQPILAVDAPRAALAARIPPMILLPLIDHLLVDGAAAPATPATNCVVARVAGAKLRIEFAARGKRAAESSDVIRDLRERLRALYGDQATLELETASDDATRMVMEIPHETTDGGHR